MFYGQIQKKYPEMVLMMIITDMWMIFMVGILLVEKTDKM